MVTLVAETIKHLPIHIHTVKSEREGDEGTKALNRHEWHSKANGMFSDIWQAKQLTPAKPLQDPMEHDLPETACQNWLKNLPKYI